MRADITLRVNAAMLPEAAKAEEVVVTQEAPTVDVGSSSTGDQPVVGVHAAGAGVHARAARAAPRRSFESVAEVAPGAKPDTFGVSVGGTTSPENRYMLDGLSVSNPGFGLVGTALSTEFIKEVNVVTAGYMPEYGRATGGMITVVTESGSNQYKAGVWSFFSPGALEGQATTVFPIGQTVLVEPQLGYIGDVGLELGGPILRDRLWFYTGVDVAQSNYDIDRSFARATGFDANQRITGVERIPGTRQRFTADMRTIQAMGKLTFAANANNRLTLALYGSPTVSGGAGKYSFDPRRGQPEIRPDTDPGTYSATARRRVMTPLDALLKWNSEMAGKKLLLDVTTGVHREQIGTRAADGSKAGSATGLASEVNTIWRRFSPGAGQGPPQHQRLRDAARSDGVRSGGDRQRDAVPGELVPDRRPGLPGREPVSPLLGRGGVDLAAQRLGPPRDQGWRRQRADDLQPHQGVFGRAAAGGERRRQRLRRPVGLRRAGGAG